MTARQEAEKRWLSYRAWATVPSRQLRKREYVAGFIAGALYAVDPDNEQAVEAVARGLASRASGYVVGADAPDLAWTDWTDEARAALSAVRDLMGGE